jgi:UDP-2,3-diacylglucosamine pyrophosphatase LpxH
MIRSLFISDTHLGTPYCQHEKLLCLLTSLECKGGYRVQNLFLIGDILDVTCCSIPLLVNQHRSIIKKIFRMADKGVRIVYIPGNHDAVFRTEHNSNLNSNFIIKNKYVHVTLDGNLWLLTHGDQFDSQLNLFPFLYSLGDIGYELLYKLSFLVSSFRKYFNYRSDFSLAHYVKLKVKNIIQFISNFEKLIIQETFERNCQGIITGHIHKADLKIITSEHGEVIYGNCGCWTEEGQESFLIETIDGEIELHYFNSWMKPA